MDEIKIIPNVNLPRVSHCEPALLKMEAGKTYSWCTCGLSEKQPLCDGMHKCVEMIMNEQGEMVLPFRSLKFQSDTEKEVWLCQCKQTSTPPYCDGTHLRVGSQESVVAGR